jgi:hypothetical protein
MKRIYLILLFVISFSIAAANRYTALYINNGAVHFLVLFVALCTLVLLIGGLRGYFKSKKSTVLAVVIIGIILSIRSFFVWGGDWKTQTIVFRDKQRQGHTIEIQMRGDRFNFGYRKRMVERRALIPYFDWINDIDTTTADTLVWHGINEHVNELDLYNY